MCGGVCVGGGECVGGVCVCGWVGVSVWGEEGSKIFSLHNVTLWVVARGQRF